MVGLFCGRPGAGNNLSGSLGKSSERCGKAFGSAGKLADAFQKGLPDMESLLDARQNVNVTCEEVHEAQITQINELDKAMGIFETMNPELFKDCKLVRALLDSGGGGRRRGKRRSADFVAEVTQWVTGARLRLILRNL